MKTIQVIYQAQRKRRVLLLTMLTLLGITLLTAGTSAADPDQDTQLAASTPGMINYQGVVKIDGNLYDGNGYFKFTIVNASVGNGSVNYWSNDGTASGEPGAAVLLVVNEGLFNVLLGDISLTGMSQSIGGTVFENDPTYLRVWFSQTGTLGSFEALEPNQRIASVGYAFHALQSDLVDGFHASTLPAANQLIALDSSSYLRVPRMVDSDNPGYYLDPASTTYLNDARGDRFSVNLTQSNTGYSVGDSATNDIDYGLRAINPDMSGVWISGAGDDGVYMSSVGGDGLYIGTSGEFGINIGSPNWSGVYIENTDASGVYIDNAGWGLYVNNASSYGVSARGVTAGGYFQDSNSGTYAYVGYGGYGVYSNGTKNFVQEHPTDPNKVIIYASLEGGEAGTYYRGTAQLQDGTATVLLPEHFSLVTEEEGLTIQVTPRADCKGLYVAEVTTKSIVVKELQSGTSNISFDFLINGVRKGYLDYQVVRDSAELMPMEESTHGEAKTGE
ncbi:MAG: hypothetical protein JSV42_00005 [Chloroflexota bacterium]|nr:MAG: hypothetical protein JSV42_00005 [Chloroflexota bacterium]